MHRFVLACALTAARQTAAGGCGSPLPGPAGQTTSLKMPYRDPNPLRPTHLCDPLTACPHHRDYLLHLPTGFDNTKPVPLVLAIHGYYGSAAEEVRVRCHVHQSCAPSPTPYLFPSPVCSGPPCVPTPARKEKDGGFSPTSDKNGFVVAYPDGSDDSWSATRGARRPSSSAPRLLHWSCRCAPSLLMDASHHTWAQDGTQETPPMAPLPYLDPVLCICLQPEPVSGLLLFHPGLQHPHIPIHRSYWGEYECYDSCSTPPAGQPACREQTTCYCSSCMDDIGWLTALITQLEADLCVDP
eukprot:gene6683-6402_t